MNRAAINCINQAFEITTTIHMKAEKNQRMTPFSRFIRHNRLVNQYLAKGR